jgi:hypothetical protein
VICSNGVLLNRDEAASRIVDTVSVLRTCNGARLVEGRAICQKSV